MNSLRTTVVTGGASGIGLSISEMLLQRGHRVVIADRSMENLAHARHALDQHKLFTHFAQLDVTQEEQVVSLLHEQDLSSAPLENIVNSAGIGAEIPFLETETAALRHLLEINLIGSFVMNREAAKRMVLRRRGSIVNIASVSGLVGNKGRAAYGASKAALINLTQVMSTELAHLGIRVNCICPGPISTPLAQRGHAVGGTAEMWKRVVPMKRYGKPHEVSGIVGLLLDYALSSFITGQIISVDGGFMASGLMRDDSH